MTKSRNHKTETGDALGAGLGEFLKAARLGANLSQADVADALKFATPQCVSNWETGRASPPMKHLLAICKMYDVSAEDLFDQLLDYSLEQTRQKMHEEFARIRKKSN